MLGWMIIFAFLSMVGLGLSQSAEVATEVAGYGISALFGALFASTLLIRRFSRHST